MEHVQKYLKGTIFDVGGNCDIKNSYHTNKSLISIPYENQFFDVVISNNDKQIRELSRRFMMIEILRVLKKEGILIIIDKETISSRYRAEFTCENYIKDLIKTGFGIIEFQELSPKKGAIIIAKVKEMYLHNDQSSLEPFQ